MAQKKPWHKRLMKSPRTHLVLSYVAAFVIRLLYLSCRVTREFPAELQPYRTGEKRAVYIFWHGRLIMQLFLKPPGEFIVLSSHHNDGALMVNTQKRFGIDTVRGSRKKGSSEAVRGLVEAAVRGANMAITPDGPRGPFQIAAPGAVYVAMRTGLPIIPIAFSATRHWRLRSWDRFMIPKPFSHIVYKSGEPYFVPPKLDDDALAAALAEVNRRLDATTAEADRACGVAP